MTIVDSMICDADPDSIGSWEREQHTQGLKTLKWEKHWAGYIEMHNPYRSVSTREEHQDSERRIGGRAEVG